MAEEYLKQYAILAPGLNNVKRQEPVGIDLQ
jgi:hypothetical protein